MAGVLVWIAYAAIEHAFSSVAPLILNRDATLEPWFWHSAAELAAIYGFIGAALGLTFGVMGFSPGGTDRGRRLRVLLTLTIIAAFLVNAIAIRGGLERFEIPAIVLAAVMALVVAPGFWSSAWFARAGRHFHPWLVSLLLAGTAWFSQRPYHVSVVRFRITGAAILAGSSIAWLFLNRKRAAAPPRALWLQALAVAVFAAMVGGAGLLLDRAAPSLERTQVKNASPGRPNILLITMDTVRADHLPLYGYRRNTTPHLTEFAKEATFYRSAVAVSDMTLPTHASMFTGRYPSWHGAHYDPPARPAGAPLRPKLPTLATMLAEHGYTTFGVAANYAYFQPFYGLGRGFQTMNVQVPVPVIGSRLHFRSGIRELLRRFGLADEFDRKTRDAGEINGDVLDYLAGTRAAQSPFFLFINYMDAHRPYLPPPPYSNSYPSKLASFSEDDYSRLKREVISRKREITADERAHLLSRYDGGIAYEDFQMALLFDRMRKLGIYDNTLIIVTSDHGEFFGNRNFIEHGVSVYQAGIAIPLIIKYPHQKAPRVVEEMVSQIDIPPTVLETAGIPVPPDFVGLSLWHEISPDRLLYSESFTAPAVTALNPRLHRRQYSVFRQFWKLIHSTTGEKELYELKSDPEEKRNLYRAGDGRVPLLDAELQQWAARRPKLTTGVDVPEQTLQRLKSLGYVQ